MLPFKQFHFLNVAFQTVSVPEYCPSNSFTSQSFLSVSLPEDAFQTVYLPQCCLLNSFSSPMLPFNSFTLSIGLTDNGPFSSFQGRSLSTSSFYASFLQVIDVVMGTVFTSNESVCMFVCTCAHVCVCMCV